MIRSELDAAGVQDPGLRDAYERCRSSTPRHGRTFFLATRLLAPGAASGGARALRVRPLADDILDDFDSAAGTAERAERLQRLATQLFDQLVQRGSDCGDDPVLRGGACTPRAVRHRPGSCSTTS